MRRAFSFLFAGLLPAIAGAQTAASITMTGSAHVAAIDQQGDNAGVSASIRQSGSGNIAGSATPDGPYPLARPYGIWQLDSSNVQAAIVQDGEGGKAAAWQKYSHDANVALAQDGGTRGSTQALSQEYVNRAQVTLLQSAGAQQALGLTQNGSELTAAARQSGPRLLADLEQYGSGLRLVLQQQGADSSAAVTQYGTSLQAEVNIDGASGRAELLLMQADGGAQARASQLACSGCRLDLRQGGNAPSAWLQQSGGAHQLRVTQH